jgi:hypothetical protein
MYDHDYDYTEQDATELDSDSAEPEAFEEDYDAEGNRTVTGDAYDQNADSAAPDDTAGYATDSFTGAEAQAGQKDAPCPYYAICQAHSAWRGPCRESEADAQKDADEHNRVAHGGTPYAGVAP